jgi:hypothetical protein
LAGRQRWLLVGVCAFIGFLGSRYMTAPRHGRYQASRTYEGYPVRQRAGSTGQLPAMPALDGSESRGA